MYPSKNCIELYKPLYGDNEEFMAQFQPLNIESETSEWMCPDLTYNDGSGNIELLGDPYYQSKGKNFNFVVASCTARAEAFGESSEDCADTIYLWRYVNKLRVIHKFVHNYLNIEHYL